MTEHADRFVAHLTGLKERDRGALAALRRSLAFEPGAFPGAFPYVERFAGATAHERDPRRLALYVVAGLFARHPVNDSRTFAAAWAELMRRRDSASIEQRFVALLGADPENIVQYLRQAISLLEVERIGFDYAQLLDDLSYWMNPHRDPSRLRQRWARDFYRVLAPVIGHENTNQEKPSE